jgi:hypothetical protein
MESIIVDSANNNYSSIDSILFNKNGTILIECPLALKINIYSIPDGTVSIADYAFNGNLNIRILNISDSVTTAESFSLFTKQNTVVSFIFNSNDPDGDNIIYRIKDLPLNGILTGNGADWVYTPNNGYIGNNSFTYITNDGTTDCNIGTVDIVVSSP